MSFTKPVGNHNGASSLPLMRAGHGRLFGLPVRVLLVLVAGVLGLTAAFLTVNGTWQFAVVVIAAIPAAIILHRYPFAALLIWMLLTPFLVTVQTSVDRQVFWLIHRALPPAAVVLVVVSSMLRVTRRTLPSLGLAEAAMFGYVLVSLAGILVLSRTPSASIIHFYDRVIAPMFLYLLVRLLRPGEEAFRWLVPVAVFVVVSQLVIGTLSWVAPQVLPGHWLNLVGIRTTGSLRHPSVYSTALTFFGLILLHVAHTRPHGLARTVFTLLFALTVVGIFMTFSRGSWLGGLIVMIGLFRLYPRVVVPILAVGLAIMMVLLTGPLSAYLEYANERLSATDSALSRLPVYYAAAQMFEARPLFGWGYLNFDLYDREYQSRVGDLVNPAKDHTSHNEYLTILAEQGITGLALFLTPALWWLLRSVRALRHMPPDGLWSRRLLLILWLALLHYLAVSSFSDIEVVYGTGLWWVTLGLTGSIAAGAVESSGYSRAAQPHVWQT